MLSFEEIEDCFPEHGATSEANGILCSAQWLHDFARAVAAKEREAIIGKIPCGCSVDPQWVCDIIRERSNAELSGGRRPSAPTRG